MGRGRNIAANSIKMLLFLAMLVLCALEAGSGVKPEIKSRYHIGEEPLWTELQLKEYLQLPELLAMPLDISPSADLMAERVCLEMGARCKTNEFSIIFPIKTNENGITFSILSPENKKFRVVISNSKEWNHEIQRLFDIIQNACSLWNMIPDIFKPEKAQGWYKLRRIKNRPQEWLFVDCNKTIINIRLEENSADCDENTLAFIDKIALIINEYLTESPKQCL